MADLGRNVLGPTLKITIPLWSTAGPTSSFQSVPISLSLSLSLSLSIKWDDLAFAYLLDIQKSLISLCLSLSLEHHGLPTHMHMFLGPSAMMNLIPKCSLILFLIFHYTPNVKPEPWPQLFGVPTSYSPASLLKERIFFCCAKMTTFEMIIFWTIYLIV